MVESVYQGLLVELLIDVHIRDDTRFCYRETHVSKKQTRDEIENH